MLLGVLLYLAVVFTVLAAIGVSLMEREPRDPLERFPPDVQYLLRAAGVRRVYRYVGRLRNRGR